MNPVEPRRDPPDEPPPFLGSWGRIYALVVIYLAALIALFSWFSFSWKV